MKSCVLFSVNVESVNKLYVLREYLDMLKTHFSDNKIFVGISYKAHITVEDIINEYNLDCEIIRLVDESMHVSSDAASFQLALNIMNQSSEKYDIIWFVHTKGGYNDRDAERKLYLTEFFPQKNYIEEKFKELEYLGVFGYRSIAYSWDKHENFFKIRGSLYNERFVKDLWNDEPTNIFKHSFCELLIIETMYAMKAKIMYTFLEEYPEFLTTPLNKFIDDRYYFEGEICNFIPTRMGYYPATIQKTLLYSNINTQTFVDNWVNKNKLEHFKDYHLTV